MKKILSIIIISGIIISDVFCKKAEVVFDDYTVTRTEISYEQLPLNNYQFAAEDFSAESAKIAINYNYGNKSAFSAVTAIVDLIALAIKARDYRYYEMDFSCEVQYGKRNFRMKKCMAVCAQSLAQAKRKLEDKCIPHVFVVENKLKITKEDLKNIKIKNLKYLDIRKSNYDEDGERDNFYMTEIPDDDSFFNYEYSCTITYEAEKPKKNTEIITESAEINYTSEMQTLGVSFFDFMNNLSEQAQELGHKKTPILAIDDLKVYKITYTPKEYSAQSSSSNKVKSDNVEVQSKTADKANVTNTTKSVDEQLQNLIEMYKDGLITKEEFVRAKERLLN